MTSSAELLRMLEPAVRPVSVPGAATARPGSVPIEQRSFESLLADATGSGGDAGAGDESGPAPAAPTAPGSPLAGIDRIENSALRDIIAARTAQA
jgi:hypothetical protein